MKTADDDLDATFSERALVHLDNLERAIDEESPDAKTGSESQHMAACKRLIAEMREDFTAIIERSKKRRKKAKRGASRRSTSA